MRKLFTRKQIPGALILLAGLAWSIYAGKWAGYLIGAGSFYAGGILAIEAVRWHGRRQVRKLLAEKPHLAYLLAVQREFGSNGKDS